MPTSFQDYYATLGVSKSATEKQIKTAFRKIARETHPDTHPNDADAERRFRAANEAYEVLGDPEKRKKYDELGPRWQEYEQWERSGQQGRNPFADFTGQTQYRTVSPEEMEAMFGRAGGGGFSDFFQSFFGAGGQRRRGMTALPGQDLVAESWITFSEAFHGTTRTVEVNGEAGIRRVEVNIPPGIRDGARVRARGQAGRGAHGGADGDLYIRVHVRPDARFTREDDDVHTELDVSLADAIAGGVAYVVTPSGKRVEVKIAAGIRNGTQMRLRGLGMPRTSGGGAGDLIAQISIQIPSPVPDELKKWAERNKRR